MQIWYNICMEIKKDVNGKSIDISSLSRDEMEEMLTEYMDRNEALELENAWLIEQIRANKKKIYGTSSEKNMINPDEQLSFFMNEAETFSDPEAHEPALKDVKKRHKAKGAKKAKVKNVPVKIVEYRLSPEDQICPECGHRLHEMKKTVRDEIEVVPARFTVKRHVSYTYACRNCESNGIKGTIITAPSPKALFRNSLCSSSLLAHIITQKYVYALPLNRQEQMFRRYGMELSRQTLSNWVIAGSKYLARLYGRMKCHLINEDIIHADETKLEVINEPGRKATQESYMWVYCSGKHSAPCVLYDYEPGRGSKYPTGFLEDFSGYLQTDGYSGYNQICTDKDRKAGPVISAGCFAHARRKFTDALAVAGKSPSPNISQGIRYCDALFAIEKECIDDTPEVRASYRNEHSAPLLDEYFAWVKEMSSKVLPKSKLGEAITYSRNQEQQLRRYLEDGRLEISNNIAERAVKPFVIGRKNWLFCNTPHGADASAISYSIVETAKGNGLEPFAYLTHVFDVMSQTEGITDEQIDSLLPWSDEIPENCREGQHQ